KSRFVKKVEYVTSPGDRVVGAVSQFGIFKRSGPKNTLQLDSYLDGPGESLSPEDAIDKLTNWDEPGKVPLTEKPISAEELKILRGLDPERIYTG
ncbi:MAG: 3-oxoacid CoA-transferase, partial [Leptospira sp.]|nr:3-oxoacid CoA-transferase [Leptospira sp.]